jgi:nicotinamidase-related amidase
MNSGRPESARCAESQRQKKVIVAGLWTEVCNTTFAVRDAGRRLRNLHGGRCVGRHEEAHDYAMQRMIQAGVVPVTWQQVLLEWQRDWATAKPTTR